MPVSRPRSTNKIILFLAASAAAVLAAALSDPAVHTDLARARKVGSRPGDAVRCAELARRSHAWLAARAARA